MSIGRCRLFVILGVSLLLLAQNHGKSLTIKRDDYTDDYYCLIRINGGLAEPQPLILCPDNERTDFVYPVEPGVGHLVAEAGQSFRIACPGSRFKLNKKQHYNDTLVTRQEFYRVIDLCHDEALGHTIYAHARIFASIDAAQTSFPRTSFRKGKFFRGIQIQNIYGRDSQRDTFARILDSETLADRYIHETGSYYLARGHLIAKSDFIYGSHQRTTFFYVNVVPMWQNVNAGNWGRMESDVRAYASRRDLDLDVWVGGLEILTLRDNKGDEREIYLYVDENGNRAVPVPKILFKVVYNYPTRSGIVFLTVNNPHIGNLTDDYRVCKDVCQKIGYMTWNRTRADIGLSYCCEIDDFRRAFPSIPCLDTKRLLS